MKRLALVGLLASSIARADVQQVQQPQLIPQAQPAFMPAPPPPVAHGSEEEAKRLRHEAKAYGAIGLGLIAGGIVVDVVALDVPQGEVTTRSGGLTTTTRGRNDANWAELGIGLTLNAVGLVLMGLALYKLKQARHIDESGGY